MMGPEFFGKSQISSDTQKDLQFTYIKLIVSVHTLLMEL